MDLLLFTSLTRSEGLNEPKYAIFTSGGSEFIKLGTGVHPPGVDELIRFWPRSAQCQRSMNLVSICYFYLVNAKFQEPQGGFSSNLVHGCTTRSRLDFGRDSRKVKGQ